MEFFIFILGVMVGAALTRILVYFDQVEEMVPRSQRRE